MINKHSKVIIFGNSSSGKSTRAIKLRHEFGLAHLDLDTLAWNDTQPPSRKPLAHSALTINDFMRQNKAWVIEGCYADLLKIAASHATVAIFINTAINQCQTNASNRPWEKHKYSSKAEQDANLPMLINWIAQYETRDDEFSLQQHRCLYNQFGGDKMTIKQDSE